MKYAVIFLLLIFVTPVSTQTPKPKTTPVKKITAGSKQTSTSQPRSKTTAKKAQTNPSARVVASKTRPAPTPTPTPLTEKEQFDKASAYELASDRVAALESFLKAFPQSENRGAAVELLASSRGLIAEEKLISGDTADAVTIYRSMIEQAPQPIPAEMFSESIAKIPMTLFFRGQRGAAIELAALIESKVEDNPAQLLEVANFHLNTENGGEAMRVAAKAAAKDPQSAAVQRTLALAHRINFDLDLSADAYSKALELEPDSLIAKRGLAEMKRALGKPDEAVALYRELLTKNETDVPARTGLILALFDAGKQTEAETELAKSLEQAPGNLVLLAGAAYWYASKGLGDKAVELARTAIEKQPRYIWSHIALARGYIAQGKPAEAEQVLVKARAYGNFPTLEYEIASARVAAGFFREAAEDLSNHFTLTANGLVKTNLGGRVGREEKSLADLVAFERKASIFEANAADTPENSDILKALLAFHQKLEASSPNESELAAAADDFAKGSDKMKIHRQLYAASVLLQKRLAIDKVLDLAKAATGNSDAGLEVANPRSAVMASELYEARAEAFRKNDYLLVPEVPKQTLSAILRGRIEDITGWAFYQQNNFPAAEIRLRRAISVFPANSAWWRGSKWRLGAALVSEGKEAEGLNNYIESYRTDKPDFAKYTIVEALYKKVNGSTDGLEAKIGRERVAASPAIQPIEPAASPSPATEAPAVTTSEPVTSGATNPSTDQTADPAKQADVKTDAEVKKDAALTDKPVDKSAEPKVEESKPAETQQPADTRPVTEIKQPADVKTEPAAEQNKPTEPVATPSETPAPITEKPTPEPANQTPQKSDQPPPDNPVKPAPDNPDGPAVTKTGEPPTEKAADKPSRADVKSPGSKPLFEPIIITIPNSRPPKRETTEAKRSDSETKSAEADKKVADAAAGSGAERPRVINGQEVKADEPRPCTIGVSQENVSLINGGGTVGLLISVEAPGDAKELAAVSSSPKDVTATVEPEISGIPDRRFSIIKSVSAALGVYQVTFSTPCGKKDIVVTVR